MANKKQKIRIRLKGYDHEIVDKSTKLIVETAAKTGARISGPHPAADRAYLYTVIRSAAGQQGLARAS